MRTFYHLFFIFNQVQQLFETAVGAQRLQRLAMHDRKHMISDRIICFGECICIGRQQRCIRRILYIVIGLVALLILIEKIINVLRDSIMD